MIMVGGLDPSSSGKDDILVDYRYVPEGRLLEGLAFLYIWDDEDLNFGNEFRVGRLARGKFEFLDDPFLSPRIPTIEDSC